MKIGDMLIAQMPLFYDGFVTVDERQSYQERCAETLYYRHCMKINQCLIEPEFYVDNVPSRANNITYEMSWPSLILTYRSDLTDAEIKEIVKKINSTAPFYLRGE